MDGSQGVEQQPRLHRVIGPRMLLLFIIGDILGTGVYALVGDVATEVGGAAWVPFLLAFLIAAVTALSYLELVTKYPHAAGAALYAQKAFDNQCVTFVVAFVVMCAGVTSASTAARFFAANFLVAFHFNWGEGGIVAVSLLFVVVLAAVNLRGVGESAKLNVGLTCIEVSGLLLVIFVGLWAFIGSEQVDYSRVVAFHAAADKNLLLAITTATSLAFFAMTGFEDSVNMVEETKDPVKTFPKVLLSGLSIAGVVYLIVAIVVVALVPTETLKTSDTPLVEVVQIGAPGLPIKDILPFISMVAVSNTALISILMASRVIYGMARQQVLPAILGKVSPVRRSPWVAILVTAATASGLILYATSLATADAIEVLGGTTSLLLLAVFATVNIAVLVLRRDVRKPCHHVSHFRTPTPLPVIGCVASLYLVTPLSGRPGQQYLLAGILIAGGVLLSLLNLLLNRRFGSRFGSREATVADTPLPSATTSACLPP
jgi:basic amino acid/polyamine antiporter, APA family